MNERVRRMIVKEFIQVLQNQSMRGVIFVLPIVQLLIFSYAVTTDVKHIALGVLDADNTVESREFLGRLTGSGYFDVVARPANEAEAEFLLDSAAVQGLVHFRKGFGEAVRAGRTGVLQLLLDGSDPNTSNVIMQYMSKIAAKYNRDTMAGQILCRTGRKLQGGVEARTRAWYNDNLESRNFFVPGVIALLVTLVSMILTTMAVVREKESGTMEQLMVTPITPWEFILGKTVPFAIISFVDVTLVTVVGVFWFDIPIRGSLALLFGSTAIYLLSILGVGLLISTVSRTQQQAMMSNFFYFLPSILLSGFMFPIANMPAAVQVLTWANPLRWYLVIVRSIFLKGVGVDILWLPILMLAVIGAVTFSLATLRMKKTIA